MMAPGPFRAALDTLLEQVPPRAGSLAITLFGDCISQQGSSVWLNSLVHLMAEFGLNARQSRTALYRLVQEGWLTAEPSGRRSYYRLSAAGQQRYARAAARIYASAQPVWDGMWTLLLITGDPDPARDELRKQLGWAGFAPIASNLLAHPCADAVAVREILTELAVTARVVSWRAQPDDVGKLHATVRDAWQLDGLATRYLAFERNFAPFESLLEDSSPTTRDAFVLRALMIHEFRRILLKSTELPPALLPPAWPGHAVVDLVRRLYTRVHGAASAYACTTLENEQGALAPPGPEFYRRLGGLSATARATS